MVLAIREALKVPFTGAYHLMLLGAIDDMVSIQVGRIQTESVNHPLYWNHLSIVQSSGTGKSRMVDEMSKEIFTIPFNFRRDDAAGECTAYV